MSDQDHQPMLMVICRECGGTQESCRASRIKCCPDCTHYSRPRHDVRCSGCGGTERSCAYLRSTVAEFGPPDRCCESCDHESVSRCQGCGDAPNLLPGLRGGRYVRDTTGWLFYESSTIAGDPISAVYCPGCMVKARSSPVEGPGGCGPGEAELLARVR